MGRGKSLAALLLGTSLSLLGCTSTYTYLNPEYIPPKKQPIPSTNPVKVWSNIIVEENDNYSIKKIELDSLRTIDNRAVYIKYYDPKGNKKVPLVLCFPILNRSFDVENKLARYCIEKGYAAAVVPSSEEKFVKNLKS